MATYNGSLFIEEQISSIIEQLVAGDELIVVDDASADDTLSLVESLHAGAQSSLVTLRNHVNVGHVRSFERAVNASSNEIMVLADQDDVWLPGYIAEIRATFAKDAAVGLIVSRPVFCDAGLAPLAAKNERYRHPHSNGPFGVAMFLLNRCMPIGSTMSVRRTDLDYLLPFPPDLYAHDHWIFAMVTMRGRMHPNNADSVQYRRHANAITKKRTPLKMIQTRVQLLWLLGRHGRWSRRPVRHTTT
jgi:glycosyltransferase involved in cell wall biosynthesis